MATKRSCAEAESTATLPPYFEYSMDTEKQLPFE